VRAVLRHAHCRRRMQDRRSIIFTSAALAASPALAQFRVEISGVGATRIPVAIGRFRNEDVSGQTVAAIVRADLERSGRFRFVESSTALDETSQPDMTEWRGRSVDALAAGSATRLADGRIDLRYKLWEVVKGSDLGGQSFAVVPGDVRLASHRIADAIYEKLTGERGVFATRIAYVTKAGTRYTLRVTDADGEGGQVALTSPEPIISPAWSPDGREVAYVSFETQKAVVWVQDLSTGQRRPIANFRGSNSAPAWTVDGKFVAATLSQAGGSQIFLISREGGTPRRLTNSTAIDTEPTFSPDGKSLYFVSDRGGGPQIYRMPADGGDAARVTFVGSYNVSPSISPDGRTMTFVTRTNAGYQIATQDLGGGGGGVTTLTDTNSDESPSFAPNGKLIIYASRSQGQDVLMTTTLDGKIKTRLLATNVDVREPMWGPYGR
jgi:TolB protein